YLRDYPRCMPLFKYREVNTNNKRISNGDENVNKRIRITEENGESSSNTREEISQILIESDEEEINSQDFNDNSESNSVIDV
ncbi:4275_t:CDS:1, partial [Cetraspora pellucida]